MPNLEPVKRARWTDSIGQPASFGDFERRIAVSFGTAILALLTVVLLLSGTYFRGVMDREQDKLSSLVTEMLANAVSRISFSGKYHARLLVEEIRAAQPDIAYVLVADRSGRVLAHSDPERNDTQVDGETMRTVAAVLGGSKREIRDVKVAGQAVREISVPYFGGLDHKMIGVIQVGIADEARFVAMRQGMLFLAGLVLLLLLIGVAVTKKIAATFGRPVIQLANDLAATIQAIPDLMFEMDESGRYLGVTTGREELLAAPREQMIGLSVHEVLPEDAALIVLAAIAEAKRKGSDYGRVIFLPLVDGGRWFELSVAMKSTPAGELARFIVMSRDITDRKQAEERLEFLAGHDSLTGLPNRLLLGANLKQLIERAQRSGKKFALLMLDLDRFKDVNDSFGHGTGDELLQRVSKRLTKRLRKVDSLTRLGGDEFTVLIEDIPNPDSAGRVALDIIAEFREPWVLENECEVTVGLSIGIALYPDHGDTPDALLQHADAALYRAKAEGRGRFKYFSDEMTRVVRDRIEMESRLRRAIVLGQLRVYYQPQVDMKSGSIVGAEALVRWLDPDEGLISPDRFIPLAEESNLISAIGEWVLRETCRQGRAWIDAGLPSLALSVNVSPRQLVQGNLCGTVASVLEATGFPPGRLVLELTESALMEERDQAVETLSRLRLDGVRLAIDDFGTGYSSLAYLKRFPLDVLKIDKRFVDDIPHHQDDMEIAATILAMGHTLRLRVLAEGVETQAQLDFLKSHDCDYYQGFFCSPPIPADAFAQLVRESVVSAT